MQSTDIFTRKITHGFVIIPFMETYGERLAYAMKLANNMSQSELARRSGVKQQTINYLLKKGGQGSKHTPTFAKILGVCSEWLARKQGPMKADEASYTPSVGKANSNLEPSLSSRDQALLDLFHELTSDQQDAVLRDLETTQRRNAEIFEALIRRRKIG